MARNLHRRGAPRLCIVAAQRAPHLPDGYRHRRSRLHRLLDLSGAGGGMDQDHSVRPDGEPADISHAGSPREEGRRGGCSERRQADLRRRRGMERERAPGLRGAVPHHQGAHGSARGGRAHHQEDVGGFEPEAAARRHDPDPDGWRRREETPSAGGARGCRMELHAPRPGRVPAQAPGHRRVMPRDRSRPVDDPLLGDGQLHRRA